MRSDPRMQTTLPSRTAKRYHYLCLVVAVDCLLFLTASNSLAVRKDLRTQKLESIRASVRDAEAYMRRSVAFGTAVNDRRYVGSWRTCTFQLRSLPPDLARDANLYWDIRRSKERMDAVMACNERSRKEASASLCSSLCRQVEGDLDALTSRQDDASIIL